MKCLSILASVAIFCSVACQKTFPELELLRAQTGDTTSAHINSHQAVQNLGTAIKGCNILWKINPSFENLEPLFTYAPNSTSGVVAVIIDNGNMSSAPFKFIAANLQTNSSQTVHITNKNGLPINASIGRVSRYMFGMNKKFYVATENGGHLVEYDPNTLTAIDLGTPFNIDGKVLDIYSLNVGKDGALYGGSFGSDGDVYTFRYDYKSFYIDKNSIDDDAKYVSYVTGDEKYTYASCGQNTWKLYAIDRSTGKKEIILSSANPSDRIYLAGYEDACYATFQAKTYRLSGTAKQFKTGDPSIGARVEYLPYQPSSTAIPKLAWSECDKKLYYKFNGTTERSVTLTDVVDEEYGVSSMLQVGNNLLLTGGKIPRIVTYNKQSGFNCVGTPGINVYQMALVPGSNGAKVVMGGYPKGAMLEYNVNQSWTIGTETVSYTPPETTSTQSNPRKFTQLQDADYSGIFGPMTLNGIFYTKDGTMIAAGNNDRLTETGSRELSIGTYKNGVKRNFALPEFSNYEFQSMCLSKDSTEIFLSAVAKYGGPGKIYRYNPISNTITANITFPKGDNPGNIKSLENNLLVGSYNDVLYIFNVNAKKFVFEKTLGSGQRIHTFTIAPDKSVWINHAYLNINLTKFERFVFNVSNPELVTATATSITEMANPDAFEGPQPSGLVFVQASTNSYDLYIAGFRSLMRINGACAVTL